MNRAENISNPNSCLNRAEDKEPIFVIRGKDPCGGDTVRAWAAYAKDHHEPAKIAQALREADDMDAWHGARRTNTRQRYYVAGDPAAAPLPSHGCKAICPCTRCLRQCACEKCCDQLSERAKQPCKMFGGECDCVEGPEFMCSALEACRVTRSFCSQDCPPGDMSICPADGLRCPGRDHPLHVATAAGVEQ